MKREEKERIVDKMLEAVEVLGDLADMLHGTTLGKGKTCLRNNSRPIDLHEAIDTLRDVLDDISQEMT